MEDNYTNFENIPEAFPIPFFDHKENLGGTIKSSAARRGMSPLRFALRKIRNIFWYRMAFFCPLNSWRVWMHRRRGCHIGKEVYIAQQCVLDNAYPELIYIEDYALVLQGSTLLAHSSLRSCYYGIVANNAAPVVVRHHANVSMNVTLLPGVEVGEYAIVSAGAVVSKKVKPYTIVQGNPAKEVVNIESFVKKNIQNGKDK